MTPSNATASLARGAAPTRKMYLFELCRDRLFLTDPNGDKTYDLGPDGGIEIGAYVEDLQAHISGVNFSTNFRYKILGLYSNDNGVSWSAFASEIQANYSTAGNKNSSPYNTRTDFGLLLKFQVVVSNANSSMVVENGTLSITLAVKVWS